jgi:hypothetical protein
LSYTVSGVGGVSLPAEGISNKPFVWIDTSGTVSAATGIAESNFTPFPAFEVYAGDLTGGSLLWSSEFSLREKETLSVDFTLLRQFAFYNGSDATAPLGFALLVSDAAPPIVLANVTAEGEFHYSHVFFPPELEPGALTFAPASPGVTTTWRQANYEVTVNDVRYGTIDVTGICGCAIDVSTVVTPGAGTYRLLFGLYDFLEGGNSVYPDLFMGALAVSDVRTVPEPASILIFAVAFSAVLLAKSVGSRTRGFPHGR